MKTRYDDKGKYFSEVVAKKILKATIQTTVSRIEGYLYILPTRRLLDELNQTESNFLAVTDARITNEEGLNNVSFLVVRSDQIVWIIPHEELEGGKDDGR